MEKNYTITIFWEKGKLAGTSQVLTGTDLLSIFKSLPNFDPTTTINELIWAEGDVEKEFTKALIMENEYRWFNNKTHVYNPITKCVDNIKDYFSETANFINLTLLNQALSINVNENSQNEKNLQQIYLYKRIALVSKWLKENCTKKEEK